MRLGINLQVPGVEEKKSSPIQRPMTTTMYINFINNMQINEQIKEKFRSLVAKMPSLALRSVVNNIHEYTRRFEAEVHQELMGRSTFNAQPNDVEDEDIFVVPEFDPIKLAEKVEQYKLKQDIEAQNGKNIEEVEEANCQKEEIQIKWVNACQSESQSGPSDQCEREDYRLHAEIPNGVICDSGLSGELHIGREQPEENSVVITGKWDDRLRSDVDSASGIQSCDNAD